MRTSEWWLPALARQLAAALDGLRLQLAALLTNVNLLLREFRRMSDALQGKIDQLSADVAAEHDEIVAGRAEFDKLRASLTEALQHAKDQGATPEQLAKLEELHNTIGGDTTALHEAIHANADGGAVDNSGTVTNTGTVDAGGTVDNAGTV